MADSQNFKALKIISNEVEISQEKMLISNHCMKAQKFLLDKLRKQFDRQKETCKYISSSNLKLESEINCAEQEIKSLNLAIETIKSGNIELKKEYLLSKERKAEILERTKTGKKKYEDMWLVTKERYENIPIVKKLNEAKNRSQTVQANINALVNEAKHVRNEIKIKEDNLKATDNARIVELAKYLGRERTEILIKINEYNAKIKEVANEVEILEREEDKNKGKVSYDKTLADEKQIPECTQESKLEDTWSNVSNHSEKDPLELPKLHLQNNDLDIFSIKLDQIHKLDSQNTIPDKRPSSTLGNLEEKPCKIPRTELKDKEDISHYFDIPLDNCARNDDKNKNYSEKKLLHILEDIKLDKKETYELIKKLEVNQFQTTKCNLISSNNTEQYEKIPNIPEEKNNSNADQETKLLVSEEIEEVEMASEDYVVNPPLQFLDASQNQNSQGKKSVSFNLPTEIDMSTSLEDIGNAKENKSQEEIGISLEGDDSFTTIKDRMLKNRNLDLSPQFMYSKPTKMLKQHEEKITSKFFENLNDAASCNGNNNNENMKQDQMLNCDDGKLTNLCDNEMVENVIVSSPKEEVKNMELPLSGFLFNHGPRGITDSLNLSISTTGFEDNEEFPQCIDSSVLLSPKADIPVSVSSTLNNEVLSLEAPNFLGGFRKTALLFFGKTNSADATPDSGRPQSGNFNFAFGNEEKKSRGGFFSMFH